MSLVARRVVLRTIPRTRNVVVDSSAAEWVAKREAIKAHAVHSTELWRKISYYVAAPAILTCSAWVYMVEKEHHEHQQHIRDENGGELPEKPHYDYLNKRTKPFPWGMNSLFFNSKAQRDMAAED